MKPLSESRYVAVEIADALEEIVSVAARKATDTDLSNRITWKIWDYDSHEWGLGEINMMRELQGGGSFEWT